MLEKIKIWLESIQSSDFDYLSQNPFWTIGLVALGLCLILLILRLRPRRRIRAFKGETGYVEISRHALLELVHSACEQLPEVRKPSIKIKARRKLNLSVRIRVDGSAHLRDTASFLQSHLKDALENNLGVEKLGKIEILVVGIKMGSSSRKGIDLNQRTGNEPSPENASVKREEPTPSPTPAPLPPAPKPDLNPPTTKSIAPSEKPAFKAEPKSEMKPGDKPGEKKT